MNNNKRKNRPSGGGGGGGGSVGTVSGSGCGGITTGGGSGNITRYSNENRQSNNKGRSQAQGIYNNAYFMHAATALVGNVVQMRLRSGNIYEGVFRTFSPNFDVALELPSCIKLGKNSPDEPKSIPNVMIFPYDTVVSVSAKDFDSQYATGGNFQTDAAISEKCNGSRFEEKELEPWDPSGMNGDVDIELDDAANGWDANDMFRKNENQFGVQSTFDDSLSSYTVPLDKVDSDEFKEREAIAEKLAAEIENNPACRDRLDLENGDEEALFAAVTRPDMEREKERDRERERERERDLERERERDREREREEREKERDRDRDRDQERKRFEPAGMSERYLTKATRSVSGPPPPVAMSPQTMGSSPRVSGGHASHDRDDRNDRNDRMINNNQPVSTMGAQSNNMQSSAAGMAGGIKNSTPSSSQMSQQDGGNKYQGSGGSMSKRKSNTPLNQKMVRNNNQQANSGGNSSGMSQGGGGSAMSQGGNSAGSQKQIIYNTMPMQNQQQSQSSYQNYTAAPMHGGPTSYRGQPKMNGDSGGRGGDNKPLPQRPMRQYSGSSSNSSMNYGNDNQNQGRHTQHGLPHGGGQGGSSPPLQSGGPHGMSGPPGNQQPPPQTQRQMRSRENQLQDLRQFGQDFQLANTSPSPGPQTQQQTASMSSQTQHMNIIKGHQPQPSVSPPQQQQPHMQQQQQHVTGHPSQHVVIKHIQHHAVPSPQGQQHHVGQPQQQHFVPQHMQQQQHGPPSHIQQQQNLPPQQQQQQSQKQMQHLSQHGAVPVSMPMQHVPQQQHITQQQQAPQQQHIMPEQTTQITQTNNVGTLTQQPLTTQNVSQTGIGQISQQQQTSPQIMVDNTTSNQQQQQQHHHQQQHLQQTSITKSDASVSATSSGSSPSDKSTPPTSNPTTSASACATNSASNTAVPVKKTHVLNPSAKPFTPRSPSTPNPSRPHTPQTPVTMTAIYTQGAALAAAGGQQTPIYMMPGQQPATAFHAPGHPQAAQQPRMRRGNYGPMTPSQMHASAATGQPLLATGPLQTQFIPYPQTPHASHFQSQPYAPQMVRMYEPQQLQFLTQTPPSTTPSPGQPHQTFHPQPQPSPAGGGPQPTFAPQTQPQYHVVCPLTIHPTQLMPSAYYPTAAGQHPQQLIQPQLIMPQHPAQ